MSFFREDNGRLSSMRLALLASVITVFAVWTFISLRTMTMQPISPEITAIMGLLAGGKALQKRWEQSPTQTTTEGAV